MIAVRVLAVAMSLLLVTACQALLPSPAVPLTPTLTFRPGVSADGPGISVADASRRTDLVLVNGLLLVEPDGTRLCDALGESFPPSCSGARLQVVGLSAADASSAGAGRVGRTRCAVGGDRVRRLTGAGAVR